MNIEKNNVNIDNTFYKNASISFFIDMLNINKNNYREIIEKLITDLPFLEFSILENNSIFKKRRFSQILFFDFKNQLFFNKVLKEETLLYIIYFQYVYYKSSYTPFSIFMAKFLNEINDEYFENFIQHIGDFLNDM